MRIVGIVLLYVLAFVLIVVGVFCGIRLYKEIQSESYINGYCDVYACSYYGRYRRRTACAYDNRSLHVRVKHGV